MTMVTKATGSALAAVLALGLASGCSVRGDLGHASGTDGGAPATDGSPGDLMDGGPPGSGADARWGEHATYLSLGPKGGYDMAVDDTDIYWTIDGVDTGEAGVYKVAKTGGTALQSFFARTGSESQFEHGGIVVVHKTGALAPFLIGDEYDPSPFTIVADPDGEHVYWSDYTGGEIGIMDPFL